MTPRQIIREISDRGYPKSSLEELYSETNNRRASAQRFVNKRESESNKGIMLNKRHDCVQNVKRIGITLNRNIMQSHRRDSIEASCNWNGLSTKNAQLNDALTPIELKRYSKDHPEQPKREVSFKTLYTTFKNISEKKMTLKTQKAVHESMVFSRMKREESLQDAKRSSLFFIEHGWVVPVDMAISNITGKSKKLHSKVMANANREMGQEKNIGRKGLYESRGSDNKEPRIEETRQPGVVQDSKDSKRLLLHIYVPTGNMSG